MPWGLEHQDLNAIYNKIYLTKKANLEQIVRLAKELVCRLVPGSGIRHRIISLHFFDHWERTLRLIFCMKGRAPTSLQGNRQSISRSTWGGKTSEINRSTRWEISWPLHRPEDGQTSSRRMWSQTLSKEEGIIGPTAKEEVSKTPKEYLSQNLLHPGNLAKDYPTTV